MRSRAWLALAVLAVVGSACSKPKSFIVLTLSLADAQGTQISGVTSVVVTVTQPSFSKTLTYPVGSDKPPLVINDVNRNDLSVSFSGARSGPVDLSVKALDASGCAVGTFDHLSVPIRQGAVVAASVPLTAHSCLTADGGVDGVSGDAFPGCDPVTPICTVPGDTCQVDCTTQLGECTQGGTGGPGTPCTTNRDCAPGAQCFDYAGTGCAVKVCLRFCNNDNGCLSPARADGGAVAEAGAPDAAAPDAGDAGGAEGGASSDAASGAASDAASGAASGPRSVCQGLVPCGDVITAYHTCTFACDPRQVAAGAGQAGCPAGLACLVVGSMDQVDCACAEASRKGVDGADCTGGADCAPGYICNLMADNSATNTKKCRAICRCDAEDMSCAATNECGGGKVCSALTNETTFGVCL